MYIEYQLKDDIIKVLNHVKYFSSKSLNSNIFKKVKNILFFFQNICENPQTYQLENEIENNSKELNNPSPKINGHVSNNIISKNKPNFSKPKIDLNEKLKSKIKIGRPRGRPRIRQKVEDDMEDEYQISESNHEPHKKNSFEQTKKNSYEQSKKNSQDQTKKYSKESKKHSKEIVPKPKLLKIESIKVESNGKIIKNREKLVITDEFILELKKSIITDIKLPYMYAIQGNIYRLRFHKLNVDRRITCENDLEKIIKALEFQEEFYVHFELNISIIKDTLEFYRHITPDQLEQMYNDNRRNIIDGNDTMKDDHQVDTNHHDQNQYDTLQMSGQVKDEYIPNPIDSLKNKKEKPRRKASNSSTLNIDDENESNISQKDSSAENDDDYETNTHRFTKPQIKEAKQEQHSFGREFLEYLLTIDKLDNVRIPNLNQRGHNSWQFRYNGTNKNFTKFNQPSVCLYVFDKLYRKHLNEFDISEDWYNTFVQSMKEKFNIVSIDDEMDFTTVSQCNFDDDYLESLRESDLNVKNLKQQPSIGQSRKSFAARARFNNNFFKKVYEQDEQKDLPKSKIAFMQDYQTLIINKGFTETSIDKLNDVISSLKHKYNL